MNTLQQMSAALEEECACKYCGRVILLGPPCCYQKLYELWQQSQKEIAWLRKVQGRQERRIQDLRKKLQP